MKLSGCAPIPLAHYLKALGIFRLVTEQVDPNATAHWAGDQFELSSVLDRDALMAFLLRQYCPTPILNPWNGDGGFFKGSRVGAVATLREIEQSTPSRFESYRETIGFIRKVLDTLAVFEKPVGEQKDKVFVELRNVLPEQAIQWIDSATVVTQEGAKHPPLLGTGGNDGSLDFSKNFILRLLSVIDLKTGNPTEPSARWLASSLFGEASPGSTTEDTIGQYNPGAAGGPNSSSGLNGPYLANPWDYILTFEGTLLFAAASVKRLESAQDGSLVYPFCVRPSGVGYASAAEADEEGSRCEMWMPLWEQPATLGELRAIFSEGRAQVHGRAARNGVDFAEAAVSLGVDRGIAAFQRYGFQVRNGLAYFATPLDRLRVQRNARVDLLADIEPWRDRLRRGEAPDGVARALRQLDERIFQLCQENSALRLRNVLVALGQAERAVSRSFKWAAEKAHPLHGLREQWLAETCDNSTEFRLARSIAGMRASLGRDVFYFRQHLEPVIVEPGKNRSWVKWDAQPGNDVLWHEGNLVDVLNAILARRLVRVQQAGGKGWPDQSHYHASLDDVAAFIEGRVDEELLADLIWGLSLIDWQKVSENKTASENETRVVPSSLYALMRLCFRYAKSGADPIPIVPAIHRWAMAGDGTRASELAARRLRGSDSPALVDSLPVEGDLVRRTAAALLFPIHHDDFWLLERAVLKPKKDLST